MERKKPNASKVSQWCRPTKSVHGMTIPTSNSLSDWPVSFNQPAKFAVRHKQSRVKIVLWPREVFGAVSARGNVHSIKSLCENGSLVPEESIPFGDTLSRLYGSTKLGENDLDLHEVESRRCYCKTTYLLRLIDEIEFNSNKTKQKRNIIT